MKGKLINFRISEEFNHLLESIWRFKKYRALGVNSKSDLFRYYVLKGLEADNKGLLKQFIEVTEVNEFLNPNPVKNDETKKMQNKVKEYFKNRGEQP